MLTAWSSADRLTPIAARIECLLPCRPEKAARFIFRSRRFELPAVVAAAIAFGKFKIATAARTQFASRPLLTEVRARDSRDVITNFEKEALVLP
jgi:hypothetical protein